jgi:hypothetical protein
MQGTTLRLATPYPGTPTGTKAQMARKHPKLLSAKTRLAGGAA